MADFLSRLAERSLGRAPLARPVVAPLFATGPELGAEGEAPDDGASAAAAAVPSTAPDAGPTTLPPAPLGRELVSAAPATGTARTVEARSPAEPDARTPGSVERARPEGTRPRTADPGPMGTPAVLPATPARVDLRDPEPARPRPQVASPAHETEPSAPVVRVFIGRIDVRAVVPPPVPARPAPSRTEDRLSLGEYLRGQTRRR
jgi:hypothetical protein